MIKPVSISPLVYKTFFLREFIKFPVCVESLFKTVPVSDSDFSCCRVPTFPAVGFRRFLLSEAVSLPSSIETSVTRKSFQSNHRLVKTNQPPEPLQLKVKQLALNLQNLIQSCITDSVFSTEDLQSLFRSRDQLLFDERSEEHTSELQSRGHLVCRLLLEKKKLKHYIIVLAVQ